MTLGKVRALHYVDAGSGCPLLMVHGNPTWSFYWRTLIESFQRTPPSGRGGPYRLWTERQAAPVPIPLQRHVDNLVALIDQLDLRETTLVAHDWGGAIGFGAAVARPDRFHVRAAQHGCLSAAVYSLADSDVPAPWIGSWCIRRWNLFARAL